MRETRGFISLDQALQAWYSKEYSRERSEWSGLPRKSACIINYGDGLFWIVQHPECVSYRLKRGQVVMFLESIDQPILDWFEGMRPQEWTMLQHIENPTINCRTKREMNLAKWIANKINSKP